MVYVTRRLLAAGLPARMGSRTACLRSLSTLLTPEPALKLLNPRC